MPSSNNEIESRYAWLRLFASFALITIGAVGMYAVIIAMPVIELEFGLTRSQSASPYSAIMVGWAIGTFWMGKLFDRYGIQLPIFIGIVGFGTCLLYTSDAADE